MGAITLALVPSSTPGDSRFALDRLCIALTKILDTPVHGINSSSYQELASEMEKDRVDYAWIPPVLMMLTQERIQLRPLLSAIRNDRTDYSAALFVDGAKPFRSLEDLRGTRVAWVDPTSASGYVIPRFHLATRGIELQGFFKEEHFLRSHTEVVRAVLDGSADVGATYGQIPEPGQPVTRAGFLDVAPHRHIRVIEWSRPIPNDMIVGHGLLSKPDHRIFSNAILTLAENDRGRRLLYAAFHADKFMTTPRLALKPIEEILEIARAHGLMQQM
jgi:phosphonate transport system substrate-binding protein